MHTNHLHPKNRLPNKKPWQTAPNAAILTASLLAAMIWLPLSSVAKAERPLGHQWLEQEKIEFKRLLIALRREESAARKELKKLDRVRERAERFVQGSYQPLARGGFREFVTRLASSPGQNSMMLMEMPPVLGIDFQPQIEKEFIGGTVGELVQFVFRHQVAPRPGTEAQITLSELTRDGFGELDRRIAACHDRIAQLKSQNASHNAALKELLMAQTHCHNCWQCSHQGYGTCGYRPSTFNFAQGEQPAGLQSRAYAPQGLESRSLAASRARTDGQRLPFLRDHAGHRGEESLARAPGPIS